MSNLAWSAKDTVYTIVYLSTFSGTDTTNRTIIDSIDFLLTPGAGFLPYEGTFYLVHGNDYVGDNLVIELGITVADDNNTWVQFDDVSLIENLSQLIIGSNMEDSTVWTTYWRDDNPDIGTFVFNYTEDVPAAGDGGCLNITVAGASGAFVKQAVTITPGHNYSFTGAFKNISTDEITNSWIEIILTRKEPELNKEFSAGDAYVIYEMNSWMSPPYDSLDIDGTFEDNFNLRGAESNTFLIPDTVTETTWYVLIKAGSANTAGSTTPTIEYLFDNISLVDLGVAGTTFSIENIVFGSVDNAEDFTGTVNLSWDADSVYLKFVMVDDSIVNAGASYQVDNIEIYFDMDNSKNIHWPRNQSWQKAVDDAYDANDYQLRLVPDVPFATNNTARPGGPSIVSGSENQVYTRTADGYEFILNIAWDSLLLGFNAAVGTEIGFDVLHSDNDAVASDANRNQITFNSPTDKPYNDPCLFGTLQLRSNGTFMRILDTEAPTVPANLAAAVDQMDVVLTWDASTDNIVVHNYVIRQGAAAIDTILAKQTDNTYTVPDLAVGDYEFRVRAVDVYGQASGWTGAVAATVTSVDENYMAKLKLYPNPANDVINISSVELIESVTITDIIGQEVMKVNINASNTQLSVEGLNSGVYFVTVKFSEGSTVSRIIIE